MSMYNSSDQQLFWDQGLCLPLTLQKNKKKTQRTKYLLRTGLEQAEVWEPQPALGGLTILGHVPDGHTVLLGHVPQEGEDHESRGEARQGVDRGGDDGISVKTRHPGQRWSSCNFQPLFSVYYICLLPSTASPSCSCSACPLAALPIGTGPPSCRFRALGMSLW